MKHMQLSTIRLNLTNASSTIALFAGALPNAAIDDGNVSDEQKAQIVADLQAIESSIDALRRKLYDLQD